MKKSLLFIAILGLVGCGGGVKEIQPFTAGDPVPIKTAAIEPVMPQVVTKTSLKAETVLSKGFEEALYLWVASTFVPDAAQGTLFVTFEKAEIKETPLPLQKKGMASLFTKEPTSKVEAKLIVHLEQKDPNHKRSIMGHFEVAHSTTLLEDTSLAERERKIIQLYQNLIQDLDQRVRSSINEGLADLII